jgi:putative ABC transport system permease protein
VTGDLRTLFLFYRSHFRVQPIRELMAIVGVAAGVALLFTVQIAHRSVTGSFHELREGLVGHATLEVAARGADGISQKLSQEIEGMPDVKASAPVLEQPIVVTGPRGRRALTIVGATEQIDALGGRISRAFQRAGERHHRGLLLLTEPTAKAIGVQPGNEVTILVAGRTEHLALDATLSSREIGAAAGSPIAASSLPIVQSLAGLNNRISTVLIEPQPGHSDALRHALNQRFGEHADVRSVGAEAALLGDATAPESQITLLFSAICLVAGILIAYNALLLASDRRRKFVLDEIRAGTPERLIIASLAFDALIVALAGTLLGLLAGNLISLVAYRSVPGYIAAAFAIGSQRIIDMQTIVIALASGMLAALAAASLPAISILRSSAIAQAESVRRSLTFTGKLRLPDAVVFACGVALTLGSITIALLAPGATVAGLIGIVLGLVVCLPTTLRLLLGAAAVASRHTNHFAAMLSVAELQASSRRSVALLAIGTVAAFLMLVIGGSVANVKTAASNGASDLMSSADVWIKPGGPENVYTTQPFDYTRVAAQLGKVAAVESVSVWRDSFLDLPHRRMWVLGVPPRQSAQVVPSQLIEGSLNVADRHLREGGWVAVSQPLAREDHVHIGQTIGLPTPAGYTNFRLAATIANYGWLPGAIVMNGAEHARLWRSDTATQLGITLRPSVPLQASKLAIERALPAGSSLEVKSADERRAEVSAVLGSTLSRLNDTTIAVLIATVAAVIALMISASWQRRGRLRELTSQGVSAIQFAGLISYETGAVLLTGCAIGIATGLGGQFLIDRWLQHTTGASVHFAPSWNVALRTLVITAVISAIATSIAVAQSGGFRPRINLSGSE